MSLARQHPIRVLFDQVTNGGPLPSRAQLDELLDRDDLPDGQSLTRFRRALVIEAERCRELSKAGDHARARSHADGAVAQFASKMTEEERGISNTHSPAKAETSQDIAARMFGGY